MLTPAQLQSQLLHAQSLHQAGRSIEAWAIMAPLRQAIDQHGQALRLLAVVAEGAGQAEAVVQALHRIVILEREPPEVVGALADALGKAGRHAEALEFWTRLTALVPMDVDAHLNRAVAAGLAGQHDQAVAAADVGLSRFPNHARLLGAKAAALKNSGRVGEAVGCFESAVVADPQNPLTRHNQAVTLRAACRFEDACIAFGLARKLGADGAEFHANWAAAALEAGRIDEAARLYRHAIAIDPQYDEAKIGLTRLQIEYRGGIDAFTHYDQIATARNQLADWIDYANALHKHRRYAEAAEVAERAMGMFGDELSLVTIHAVARGSFGDAKAALERLEQAFARRDDRPLNSMATLALRSGDAERAAHFAEMQTSREPDDQNAWAILSLAWRVLGDPREQWLCDYDRLVMVTEIPSPGADEMEAILDPLHQTMAEPGDQSLRQGTQTSGALFARPEPSIQRFKAAVIAAAEHAVSALRRDPNHPFLRRRSDKVDVAGSWSVRLSPAGHHVSHIHSQGWMSSAYYARLPTQDAQAIAMKEGWINFGQPPEMFNLSLGPRKVVEPKRGLLVLFPSYMWHGTQPFKTGDRLTAAFDFVPR